ncbi:TetR family transcriptional regulator [Actinomadura graeca]|uniref:TetR family transcriptional regulator n=1 Tax=Actinomadura graeca TaxID=2750812 RepID=A0ABX8QYB2_9ACTN|nr:TetR family transcriptional regulator [Actinomadura graeca]QXJ23826.1 TetR family transcriptional regulator [Actinomadura graeca]
MTASYDIDDDILDAAGKLFSQLGYDSTTLKMISEVARVETTLLEEIGREQIYRQVFARLRDIETARIDAALSESTHGVEGIHRVIDAFFDFIVDHPQLPALWSHRGLGDATDVHLSLAEDPPPFIDVLTSTPWEGVAPDLDLRLLAWIVIWSIGTFVHNGFMDEDGRQVFPDDPHAVRRLREQLHKILDALNRTESAG